MKNMRRTAVGALALVFWGVSSVQAGSTHIDVSVVPKKENKAKKQEGVVTREETLFQYTVKLTNKSFAPVAGLSAQYRIFIRDDSGAGSVSQQKLKRQEFTASIPALPNGGVHSFETEAVKLETSTLGGGWSFTDGRRPQSKDKVMGVWIRILQGDKIVGEYINPSTLATKEKF